MTGKNGILIALNHNKRVPKNKYGPNIDLSRTQLNYSLHDDKTPDEIAKYAKGQMFEAGIERTRKNGVMAVEIVFSLPNSHHQRDTRPFFKDCYDWVLRTFDGELLSFDVHLDESAPHAHALILPLIDGKMQGSNMKGNRENVLRINKSFSNEVASRYGLIMNRWKRLTPSEEDAIKRKVFVHLKDDSAMSSKVWPCIRDAVDKNPLPFAEALSIETHNSVAKNTNELLPS